MHELETILRSNTLRLTEPRKQVYDVLKASEAPQSMAHILKRCTKAERTSVYRCLDLFINLGIVELTHIGWKKVYELSSPYKPHHHHFYCTRCESYTDIESDALERMIDEIAQQTGSLIASHTFEAKGLCRQCRNVALASSI